MQVSLDFHGGVKKADTQVPFEALIEQTAAAGRRIAGWPHDRVIELLDQFSERLLDRNCELVRRYPDSGVPFVAHWCRRTHLESIVDAAFENRSVLDAFSPVQGRPDRHLRAFPRGLVVHWMAGNVPTLGFLSLIQGMLTKNANIVKPASASDRFLADLLDQLCFIETDADNGGRALAESVAVVRFDRSDVEHGKLLSQHADVRILWGDDSSVTEIKKLPAKLGVQDIVFPSKTSLILVSREALARDLGGLVRRMALDISTFEQKACASPHTVFLETTDSSQLVEFAGALKSALGHALSTFPKLQPSSTESAAILNLRAEYDMFHQAWYSGGIEYTILTDDSFQIGPAIGNRTIFLRKIEDLERVADLITEKVQTVGLAAGAQRIEGLTTLLGERGVQRFTRVGTMTHFEVPWDGYLIPQALVRWTSRATFEQETPST